MAEDVLTADTCACGSTNWHKLVDERIVWCRLCGSLRQVFQSRWLVPLEQAGKLSHTRFAEDETPTAPGTPDAKPR
jgi:hypothetical protein